MQRVALCVLLQVIPLVAQADSMRCGSRLISEGDRIEYVLEHCGEPTAREVEQQAVRAGNRQVGTTTVERWTYSDYAATRVFVFDGDKLIRIE